MPATHEGQSEMLQIDRTDQILARHADRTFQDVATHLPTLGLSNPSCADRFVRMEPTDNGHRTVVGVTALSAPDATGQRVAVTAYRSRSREIDGYSIEFGKGYAVQTLEGTVLAQHSSETSAQDAASFAIGLIKPNPLSFAARVRQTPASHVSTLAQLADTAEIA